MSPPCEGEEIVMISSPRGVDRPYIRGVQDAAVARGEIDLHLRISIPSTPVRILGGVRGPWLKGRHSCGASASSSKVGTARALARPLPPHLHV